VRVAYLVWKFGLRDLWVTGYSFCESHPIYCEFAYFLRMHVASLHPDTVVVDLSSDDDTALSSLADNNGDLSKSLIPLPPGFPGQPVSVPPHGNMLVPGPLDPARQQMIGQHMLFKWPTYGWCLCEVNL